LVAVCAGALVAGAAAGMARRWFDPFFQMTLRDFHLPGTQVGAVGTDTIWPSTSCTVCHGDYDVDNDHGATWSGSLMGLAGKDPLFYAQMTTANQDVANAGYYCLRCHVPMSFVTGHALQADGSTLDDVDRDGVTCHFCHSMVDPIYRPGISPPQDQAILAALPGGPPAFYGNAMFVLDPTGTRRGPYTDASLAHNTIYSPFHLSGNMCGTCHEVGNVAVTRQPDGTYRYNAIDEPTPVQDPAHQFPLERTFSEWRLSAFANGGVDMGGRFGGEGAGVVSTCQDCHMPRTTAQGCFFGPTRPGMKRHEFAGAAAQVLDLIAAFTADDWTVDQAAIARGRAASVSMLQRAASLAVWADGGLARVRITNESGHKLPTGHIEGRRVWVNVRFLDGAGSPVGERGRYDLDTATLEEHTTTVYEMHVGLSEFAAAMTGLQPGPTGRMALADTIVKDSRIPPRGFTNAAFEAAGAPVVEHHYADGQYWDDLAFPIPRGTARIVATAYYQNTPRQYIEMLRDNNHTDQWGQVLHNLWVQTGRGAPIAMTSHAVDVPASCPADWNRDGAFTSADVTQFVLSWFDSLDHHTMGGDLDGDGRVAPRDIAMFVRQWIAAASGGGC
jgi:hypothetical protein